MRLQFEYLIILLLFTACSYGNAKSQSSELSSTDSANKAQPCRGHKCATPTPTPTPSPTPASPSPTPASPSPTPTATPVSSPSPTATPLPTATPVLSSSSFYVSPTGSDLNSGSISAPFKTLSYAASKLSPGSTLYVRGGLYEETLKLSKSGTATQPITIAAYPGETPVLSGTTSIKSFLDYEKVISAEPALLGNPNWSKLYRVRIPAAQVPTGKLYLIENDKFMKLAEIPFSDERVLNDKQTYAVITDGVGTFNTAGAVELLRSTPNYWLANISEGKYPVVAAIWSKVGANHIYFQNVLGSSGDLVTFDPLKYAIGVSTTDPQQYSDRIAIINHPEALKAPGDFVYYKNSAGDVVLYIWPQNATADQVSLVTRPNGIIPAAPGEGSYTVIDGLTVKGFGNDANTRSAGVIFPASFTHSNFRARNMQVQNIIGFGFELSSGTGDIVESSNIKNVIEGRGISLMSGTNAIARNNTIDSIERTGIYFGELNQGQAIHNKISRLGIHGNGISAYQSSSNILIANNIMFTNKIGITYEKSNNIMIFDNIISTNIRVDNLSSESGDVVTASWGGDTGEVIVANNLFFVNSGIKPTALSYSDSEYTSVSSMDVRNNINCGGLPKEQGSVLRQDNLFSNLSWYESSRYGWTFQSGELLLPSTLVPTQILTLTDVSSYLTGIAQYRLGKANPLSDDVLTRYHVREAYQQAGVLFNSTSLSNIGPLN